MNFLAHCNKSYIIGVCLSLFISLSFLLSQESVKPIKLEKPTEEKRKTPNKTKQIESINKKIELPEETPIVITKKKASESKEKKKPKKINLKKPNKKMIGFIDKIPFFEETWLPSYPITNKEIEEEKKEIYIKKEKLEKKNFWKDNLPEKKTIFNILLLFILMLSLFIYRIRSGIVKNKD